MALQHAIMTALLEDEMSGYELAKAFDSSLGFFWRASHQQIYQELKKLSAKGLLEKEVIRQASKPNKITYSLTDQGRTEMEQWVYQESKVQEGKDDLFVKLYNLNEANTSRLILELEQRRELTMQRLYLYEKIRRGHYQDPVSLPVRRRGVYLALAWGIQSSEQFLQWCDVALQMLATVEAPQA